MTVALSGVSSATTVTDDNGQYAFTGLRQGSYSVEISGFDSDEVGFSNTSSAVTVDVGESKIVSFDGTYLRTAGIQGQVSVEGVGLEGVNVSLTGGPDGQDMTTTTDAAGLYSFARLRAGDYAVGISGYDTDEYEFAVTSQNVTVALGETANLPFDGILLRTSGVAGRVSVGGMGIADVTVTVSADGMDDVTAMTDATGQYAISALAAGDYTVTISGYDATEYSFEDSQAVTLAMDQTAIVNFEGMSLRTANIAVSVTADDEGVAGAAVTVTMITGATSGTVVGTQATDADGAAAFGNLLAGNYRVDIAVDSDEIDFESTDAMVAVATGETAEVSFEGTVNRTASISGSVTVDGEGMGGVAVALTGGEEDMSAETGDDGSYSFTGLRKGDYTVSITNPDENRYEFSLTSRSVSLAVGQEQNVNFAGLMTRSSTISGTVSVEGSGIADVTVTLSAVGMDDRTNETDDAGGYAFAGLGAGDYTVAITLSDDQEAAYNFETTSMDVSVGDNDVATANFDGVHDASADISGMLFVDEAAKNGSYDEGEDPFPAAGIPVVLVGPEVDDLRPGTTDETGTFSFPGLVDGTYRLVVGIPPEVAMTLGDYTYGGPAAGYEIELGGGGTHMQAIPFNITHQTVDFSVWLKHGDDTGDALPGATVKLYADQAGNNQVGTGVTDDAGATSIRFAREGTSGNTVFAGIEAPEGDYEVVADGKQAVMWEPKSPTGEVVTNTADIVNLKADLTFSGKTVMTDAGFGGKYLAGWAIDITMMDEDGNMVAVEDAAEELGDGEEADSGMAAFMSMAGSADDLPMTYYFAIDPDSAQDDDFDGGEMFMVTPMPTDDAMADGAMLKYVHDGLSLAGETDLGTLEVKYTTQTLKVAVHQERDQVSGYTGNILDGDNRPTARVITTSGHPDRYYDRGITLQIRHIGADGRSHLIDGYKNPSRNPYQGGVTFANVPADLDIVVKATIDPDRKIINDDEAQTYRDFESAMIMKGAFGENGGENHTVEACPESAAEPYQDFVESCSTFAYVWVRDIMGRATARTVERDAGSAGFAIKVDSVAGIEVDVTPRDTKNVQAEAFGATTLAENDNTVTVKELGSYTIRNVGDGHYRVSVTSGWRPLGTAWCGFRCITPGVDEQAVASSARGPNAATPADITIDVVPNSVYLYGTITDQGGQPLDGVEVNVGSKTVTTDPDGRYILADLPHAHTFITVTKPGYAVTTPALTDDARENGYSRYRDLRGADNTPAMQDFVLTEQDPMGIVKGTVTHAQSGAPLANVIITAQTGTGAVRQDTTDADGAYELSVVAGAVDNLLSTVTPARRGMFFTHNWTGTVVAGSTNLANFQGLEESVITGRVVNTAGVGVPDITITLGGGIPGFTLPPPVMTASNGTYRFSVPWGGYTITPTAPATRPEYTFDRASDVVGVGSAERRNVRDFVVSSFRPRNTAANRVIAPATAGTPSTYGEALSVSWDADALMPAVTYSIEVCAPTTANMNCTAAGAIWDAATVPLRSSPAASDGMSPDTVDLAARG